MADAQTKPPTKDTRLVVRLEAEDLAYVREQGEALSLDASTWVRMMIRKLRKGQIGEAPPPMIRAAMIPVEDVAAGHWQEPAQEAEPAAEPVNLDDLVAGKMAEADSRGLTLPRASAEDDDMGEAFEDFTGGIRPVGERKAWQTGSPKDFRRE